ncbi:MAG: 16S rRNA (guanine(966)-N(2))-methyltransferase RsmD [Acidobacteriaceae bacterium]
MHLPSDAMRIIAGTYRSRQLVAPKGMDTRPTSDRLRETLFNVIAPYVAESRFVDLYAGSGAVGIEALSRGAKQVWFAEKAAPALAALRANLKALGIRAGYGIDERGVLPLLRKLAAHGEPVEMIFLDPPYEAEREYQTVLDFLGSSEVQGGLVTPQTLVIAEHRKKSPLAEKYGALQRTRVLKQGDAALSFFRVVEGE